MMMTMMNELLANKREAGNKNIFPNF